MHTCYITINTNPIHFHGSHFRTKALAAILGRAQARRGHASSSQSSSLISVLLFINELLNH